MTHLTRGDSDLHHEDGSHRTTPASTAGRVLESHEGRIKDHLAQHAAYEGYDYEVQGDYGQGWEMVTTEDNPRAAKESLRTYRENEPGIPFRTKRVKETP